MIGFGTFGINLSNPAFFKAFTVSSLGLNISPASSLPVYTCSEKSSLNFFIAGGGSFGSNPTSLIGSLKTFPSIMSQVA